MKPGDTLRYVPKKTKVKRLNEREKRLRGYLIDGVLNVQLSHMTNGWLMQWGGNATLFDGFNPSDSKPSTLLRALANQIDAATRKSGVSES